MKILVAPLSDPLPAKGDVYFPVIATAACFIDAETLNRAEEKRSVNGYPFTERFLILPSLTQTSPLTRGCLAVLSRQSLYLSCLRM